jgi:hypothetical protein
VMTAEIEPQAQSLELAIRRAVDATSLHLPELEAFPEPASLESLGLKDESDLLQVDSSEALKP